MSAPPTPGRGESPAVVDSQQPRPGNITGDEEAILRSFVAGNHPMNIAKARRLPESGVQAVIRDLCDFDRNHARRVLATGACLPPPKPAAPTAKATAVGAERRAKQLAEAVDQLRRQLDAAAAQLEHARAQLDRRPKPLVEYGALWCGVCRSIVPSGHRHSTAGVTIAVLPREAT